MYQKVLIRVRRLNTIKESGKFPCSVYLEDVGVNSVYCSKVNGPLVSKYNFQCVMCQGLASAIDKRDCSLSLFCKYCFGRCLSDLAELVPLPYSQGRSTHYPDSCMIFPSPFPMSISVVSLPLECFPLTYDPNGFKSRINRNFFICRFFLNRFLACFNLFVLLFSFNFMPCSGCSFLNGVNPNFLKKALLLITSLWK